VVDVWRRHQWRTGGTVLAVRQYLSLTRRRPKFIFGLLVVFGLSCACFVVAHTGVVFHDGAHESLRDLSGGFGEALIISVVLACLVDPLAQHQFASEWGRDLYWAIFSPRAPQEFRDALQALAAPSGYLNSCTYEVIFSYPADGSRDYFEIDWQISLAGVTLDRHGFKIQDPVFVVSRHDGSPSSYTRWTFQSEDSVRVAYNEDELISLGAMSIDASGRTVLDQRMLPGTAKVPFGKKYWSERHLQTSRWQADYLPMFQPRIVLQQIIIIKGDPVSDLEFSVTQLGRETVDLVETSRPDGRTQLECRLDSVAFPGQASLISWRARTSGSQVVELPIDAAERAST
jgi:hypothetical protein